MAHSSRFQAIAPANPLTLSPESPTSETSGRKKATVACFACKRRRSKCDPGIPCVACISHNTDCVKDEHDDGRRKVAIKRRIEDLESDRQLLESFFTVVRQATPHQLLELQQLIRNDVPRQNIRTYLDNYGIPSLRRRLRGRIQDIVNPPITVPARPWTTVTDEDDLVSHLISLWFTWAHPWWHWVDKDLFLEAMRSGDTSSLICTPYLVNMILADSCLLDTLAGDDFEHNLFIRDQFYYEAKRGLDAEEGRVSLALLATLGVQWTYLNTNGQDKIGNPILTQQLFLIKDLERWRSRVERIQTLSAANSTKIDASMDRLCWSLFSLNSFTLMNLNKTHLLPTPSRSRLPCDHQRQIEQNVCWSPYPRQRSAMPFHPECHYACMIDLAENTVKDERIYVRQDQSNMDQTKETLIQMYQEIEDWPNGIPSCMQLTSEATPHVLALHMLYNWIMVMLSKQAAAFEAGVPRSPPIVHTPSTPHGPDWKEASRISAVRIGHLLEQLRLNWGTDHFPVIIMQPASVALFALLEHLDTSDEARAAFMMTCLAVRSAGRRFRVARGVLRTLEEKVRTNNVVLSSECRDIIVNTEPQQSFDISSIGVDYLLDKWHDLDLG